MHRRIIPLIPSYIHTCDVRFINSRDTKDEEKERVSRQRMTVTVSRCLVSAKRLILSYGHGGTQAPPAPPSRAPRTTAGNYRPFRLARSSIPTELGLEPDLPLTRLPVHTSRPFHSVSDLLRNVFDPLRYISTFIEFSIELLFPTTPTIL
jgi:hypothetical protein